MHSYEPSQFTQAEFTTTAQAYMSDEVREDFFSGFHPSIMKQCQQFLSACDFLSVLQGTVLLLPFLLVSSHSTIHVSYYCLYFSTRSLIWIFPKQVEVVQQSFFTRQFLTALVKEYGHLKGLEGELGNRGTVANRVYLSDCHMAKSVSYI